MARQPTVRDMPFISVVDMAEALGVHKETVLRYIRQGIIKATRPKTAGNHGRWKIPREFALRFIAGEAGHVPLARPKRTGLRAAATPESAPNPRQLGLYERVSPHNEEVSETAG